MAQEQRTDWLVYALAALAMVFVLTSQGLAFVEHGRPRSWVLVVGPAVLFVVAAVLAVRSHPRRRRAARADRH